MSILVLLFRQNVYARTRLRFNHIIINTGHILLNTRDCVSYYDA